MRTASLRAAFLASVAVATSFGVIELAAFQVATTLFFTLAFILDALAIAGQALTGHSLGAADVPRVRDIMRRLIQWGIGSGVVLGILLAASSFVLGPVFTSTTEVQDALAAVALLMAVGVPLAGYVFVLDGVLIGAGDAKYLAITGLVNLGVYLPLLAAVYFFASGDSAILWLWAALGFGYIGARAVTLGLRSRSTAWMVTGAR